MPNPTPPHLLRLPEVLKIIPVSKSNWWAGVKTGRYPKPVRTVVLNAAAVCYLV